MNNVFFNFKNWFLLYLKKLQIYANKTVYICENAYANFDNVCLFEKNIRNHNNLIIK